MKALRLGSPRYHDGEEVTKSTPKLFNGVPGVLVVSALLAGCGSHEGGLSTEQPAPTKAPTAEQAGPISFRYASPVTTYHYAFTTITSIGGSNARTFERQFSVQVTKVGNRFQAESTIQASLTDGKPTPGVTESMLKGFKLTTALNAHGDIISSHGEGTAGFVQPDAKDLGTSFAFPNRALRPGDSWSVDRGSYSVKYTFVDIEMVDGRRVAKFEERASDGKGGNVERPTVILVDPATGVLVDKIAETLIPGGPNESDPFVPARSEIKLR